MSIKQFNGNYLPGEDRLMFRFNTQNNSEYRLWLSRRVTLFVLAATEHLVEQRLTQTHSAPAAKAITQFAQDTAKSQADFTVQYQVAMHFPLGHDPVLVTDVKCAVVQVDGTDAMTLDFAITNHPNLIITLAIPTLITMRLLLERLADNAQWGRGAIASASTTTGASIASIPVQAVSTDADGDDATQTERLPTEKISKKLH